MLQDILRKIPSVDRIINKPYIQFYISSLGRERTVRVVRDALDDLKSHIVKGQIKDIDEKFLECYITDTLKSERRFRTRRVINATGVVLHTNLGRAVLSEDCIKRLNDSASGYCDLEFDLKEGKRGNRYRKIEKMLTEITGCEAAAVVNNNAAAVLLMLTTLAKGKEVVISRGELVEIGGSFRVPDVMTESGAVLKEVGTTNKTRAGDYEKAYDADKTAMLLKIHTSNFKIIGFTESPSVKEIAEVAHSHGIPAGVDLGSGLIYDLTSFGLPHEPSVMECLKDGADIVTFSGDKLLGGPQSGIIIGKKSYIDEIKSHPLIRALRIDKLSLICLEETLSHYYSREDALFNIPTLKMLTADSRDLADRAKKILKGIENIEGIEAEITDDYSEVGGGSMPGALVKTCVIKVKHSQKSVDWISQQLRSCDVPIVCRTADDTLIMDMRTLGDGDVADIVKAMCFVLGDDK